MNAFTSLRAVQTTPSSRRAPHRVAFELITRIKSGAYKRGSWLPTEQELLREFPVSRGALREALTILQCLELVEPRRSVGTRVLGGEISVEDLFDASVDLVALLEACCVFEVESIVLAARLCDERCVRKPPGGTPDLQDFRQFHLDLAHATGNGALIASIGNLWALALARPMLRALFAAAITQSTFDFAHLQGLVARAVEAGDPDQARRAAKTLFDAYLSSVLDAEEAERLRQIHHESRRRGRVWKSRLSIDTRTPRPHSQKHTPN
jgi:DNA-binding FadR family transcriptional regulator